MICLCFLSSGFFSRRLILLLVAPFIKTILLFSVAIALLERLNTTKHFTFMQSGQKCFFFCDYSSVFFSTDSREKKKETTNFQLKMSFLRRLLSKNCALQYCIIVMKMNNDEWKQRKHFHFVLLLLLFFAFLCWLMFLSSLVVYLFQ